MNLVRWEPFKELDEFFDVGMPSLAWRPRLIGDKGSAMQWTPAADISETEREYVIRAELPGVKKEDIKITLEDRVLTITGQRKEEMTEKDEKRHRVERFYGSFTRSFGLPENVDESAIRAENKDGVLCVWVPKSKAEKSKSVEIKVD